MNRLLHHFAICQFTSTKDLCKTVPWFSMWASSSSRPLFRFIIAFFQATFHIKKLLNSVGFEPGMSQWKACIWLPLRPSGLKNVLVLGRLSLGLWSLIHVDYTYVTYTFKPVGTFMTYTFMKYTFLGYIFFHTFFILKPHTYRLDLYNLYLYNVYIYRLYNIPFWYSLTYTLVVHDCFKYVHDGSHFDHLEETLTN